MELIIVCDGRWGLGRGAAEGRLHHVTLLNVSVSRRLSVAEAVREIGVNLSTCYRWRTLFEPHRRVSNLLSRGRGKPTGVRMMDVRWNT